MKQAKVLYLVPHLSTGGMPAFVLKTIEVMQEYINVCVVEYNCYSLDYVVQRDKIIELVGNNFYTLFEDKTELFSIIKYFNPDIIHIHEPSERFDAHIMSELYRPNRLYKIIETCHDVSFDPKTKIYHPDAHAFCTPYHYDTFAHLPSYKQVIEYPIDSKKSKKLPGINNVVNVGLWTPGKNQAEGIEIARKNPNFNFNFVGNQAGNFKDYWEPLMADLPSNVKVWGERDDVDEFLKHANIFMFNSTWECNPLVLREAISYGLPIIAHNLPQYGSMFEKYIQPIDTDLNTIKCNYIVPTDNTSEIFAEKYNNFYNKVLMMLHQEQDLHIYRYFIEQPFLEIKCPVNSEFKVQYFDENDVCQYENTINSNSWVRLNREYYTEWNIKVFELDKLVYEYKLSLENRRVFITLASESLGDTIAWAPYALAFQKKHNCKVILSTFWNHILDIPEIELVEPGMVVNDIYAQYNIGWHYDENKEPVLPNTIKLQEAATNILGLEFQELKPKLKYKVGNNKYGKYVTIATNSTAGCKFWTREGWQKVITYLHNKGYKVVNVSKEDNPFEHCQKIDDIDIENTMSVIYHSQFTIGLSSGLSWLAYVIGKPVVMISNFTTRAHEFKSIRVVNENVCHGCWNNPEHKFDRGDFDWCPRHKNTPRQFECQRSITAEDVIKVLPLPLL